MSTIPAPKKFTGPPSPEHDVNATMAKTARERAAGAIATLARLAPFIDTSADLALLADTVNRELTLVHSAAEPIQSTEDPLAFMPWGIINNRYL